MCSNGRVLELKVEITELVEDGQVPWVRCRLRDAKGRHHHFDEKLPVVSSFAGPVPPLPIEGRIACTIVSTSLDAEGRQVVKVDTSAPWGCETSEGLTLLDVFDDQLEPGSELELRIAGRLVAPGLVGTNDGLNYGRFFARQPLAYEAQIPIAELDAYAEQFAALVDEMEVDDRLDPPDEPPSELAQMGYPRTLAAAAEHPRRLAAVVKCFSHRELLGLCFPFEQLRSRYVINATDEVFVVAGLIVIRGRCWEYAES